MKNRYFIVFYIGTVRGLNQATGSIGFTTNGTYLNLKESVQKIKESNSENNLVIDDVVITNIIELGEKDYKYYYDL